MSMYYKLNDKTDVDDVKMIASLVGMEVLQPVDVDEEVTDRVLTEMASETWIFRPSTKNKGGSTLKVGVGTEEGVAECGRLAPGYYHIIKADR